jgi:DNA repair exonuclease SbcCD ATPase subunit
LHDTSTTNEDNSTIDEAILVFLSKKSVTDQNEQSVLARISSKVQASPEQAEMSVQRLCAKDWIRRYKLPGKVSFELAPKGQSALEALAKVHTARVTSQLQQAIHQERKAKLRSSIINKFESVEDEWQTYQVPDRNRIGEVEQAAAGFLAATKEIEEKRPFCDVNPKSYDQEFQQYKTQIENFTQQNINLSKAVNEYAKIKNDLQSISADIEKINKAISRFESLAEATAQTSKLKTSLSKLKPIQSQLENFEKNQLTRLEELKTKLAHNAKLIETLKKPTHEFAPVKKESPTEKQIRYPDPEGPIKYDRKTSRYPIEEKCGKCGTKRKSNPVNIG